MPTKALFLIAFLFTGSVTFSQENPPPPPPDMARDTTPALQIENAEDKIFEQVEMEAMFPGGQPAWRKFLELNLDPSTPVNKKKRAKRGSYTVWVQFVVDKEGNISEITPLTKHGFGMEEEVVRIIKKSPKWVPAKQNGRLVKAYRKQPITFVVE